MFDLQTYTLIHTAVSLAALVIGIKVLFGLAAGRGPCRFSTIAIVLLLLTSASGFGFPFEKFLPSHAVGILSLLSLAVTVVARWVRLLAGGWNRAYVISLTIAVWFDAFVTVVQAFLKVPALQALAPTQESPGFIVAQGVLLIAFVALGVAAVRGQRHA